MPLIARSLLAFLLPASMLLTGCGDDSTDAVDDVEDDVSELRERVAALEAMVAGSGSGGDGDGGGGDGGGTGGDDGGTGGDDGGTGGDDGGGDERVTALEDEVDALRADVDSLLDMESRLIEVETDVAGLEGDVSAVLTAGQPVIDGSSGGSSGTVAATSWTTISGSEVSLALTAPGTLMAFASAEFGFQPCAAAMKVEVVDSSGAVVGQGLEGDAAQSTYSATGPATSSMVASVPSAGSYTVRIRYQTSTGSNCYLYGHETDTVFFPSW